MFFVSLNFLVRFYAIKYVILWKESYTYIIYPYGIYVGYILLGDYPYGIKNVDWYIPVWAHPHV